ncbi:MAG: glutamyl-tRNA(Gln) amidotransferase subunit E [archaeon GW2011_AR3]|nr:MAG: glutamyl-tRNA(Gln) amidotransferase subunit E [archaeon GW2011_AR3]MBS3109319.1 Glu-tRNA(Gln) amidotransferase subunit GatE [Candidatus Woesearchaeota archaeon]
MNYNEIGFKCGLEIHQQLDTSKLFCNCSSEIRSGKPDKMFRRRLRAAAGESGRVDAAAEHEQKKGKYFDYQYYNGGSCLVELDEEPPRCINQEALQVAIQLSQLLNMKISDQIQVMRKTVVDGSNTTGFQRTALVARDGFIETSKGRVTIQTLCIEEESAQLIERNKTHDVYNLSRLGIPLIEIATGTEIVDPTHAMEAAEKIGMILRSTRKVKRGIGTIRQDVNLSIAGMPRMEIKGFQELKSIPKIIDWEIRRLEHAKSKGEKMASEVRKAEPDFTTKFLRPMPGADRMYPETDVVPIVPNMDKADLPELIDEKAKRYEKEFGISRELAGLAAHNHLDLDAYAARFRNVKPGFIAEFFLTLPKEIKRRYDLSIEPGKYADEILARLDQGKVPKEAAIEILVEFAKTGKADYSRFAGIPDGELEAEINKIVESNPGKSQGALMGMVMAKFRGKADGKKIADFLNKILKK